MTLLSFLVGVLMIGLSGWALARFVLPANEKILHGCAAYPFGALLHVFVLLVLTVLHAPIVWWIFLPAHVVLATVFFFLPKRAAPASLEKFPSPDGRGLGRGVERILRIFCIVLLSAQFLFAFSHAVLLPTYHIDSLTNWTHRAKISWLDQRIAFDETEVRGVAKPQYPFLVHGVQMAVHVVSPEWNDRAANASTFLLTFSSLGALFVLLRKLRGMTTALAGLAAITSIPLLSFHLAQGYGDIHLVTYLLLSLGFVLAARISQDVRWYIASALMIVAASWTKTEGAVIGLLPWLLLVGIDLPLPQGRRTRIKAMGIATVFTLLLPLFLLLQGLPLTPHDSDSSIGLHLESVLPALRGIVFSPSMGTTWWGIAIAFGLLMVLWRRNDSRIDCRLIITLFWGVLALLIVLATYTLTANARFLLNGESYFRQLMVPASLLILAIAASVQPKGVVRGEPLQ